MPIARIISDTPTARHSYVFVHGSPSDHRVWLPMTEHAPRDARLVLVELLDHGSAPDDESPDCANIEADLQAIVKSIQGPITLVGHSAGAYLAARLLPAPGERVSRAVLIAGFAWLPPELAAGREALWQAIESGELSKDGFAEAVTSVWLGSERPVTSARPLIGSIFQQFSPARTKRHFQRIASLSAPEARVRAFDTPALVIHSRREAAIPYALGVELAGCARHGELVTLEDDSHWLRDEHAKLVFAPPS